MKNRPLKFRAWTGATMEYNVLAGQLGAFYCAGLDPKDSACLSPANTIYGAETPIMQWTGLLDKNGKEIYEDDIVVIALNKEDRMGVVKWDKDTVRFYHTVDFTPYIGISYWGMVEVVGNIYEHIFIPV